MNASEEMTLLGELAGRLEEQIELARQGSFGGLERLMNECRRIVVKIKNAGLLEKPEYLAQRQRLVKLYNDLQLALSMQKDAAAEQLKTVCEHKKTLATYRNNI